MVKGKRTNNDLQKIHKTKDRVTRTQIKTRDEVRCSGRVSSSCSTSGTRCVNLVTNPVISHEWGKDRQVLTTSGTYPWSFVTQIFHNGQPNHGGDRNTFEVMEFVSTERDILHIQVLLECCYIWMESPQWEIWNNLFSRQVSFLTAPYCQFRGVGQGMKQVYLCVLTT